MVDEERCVCWGCVIRVYEVCIMMFRIDSEFLLMFWLGLWLSFLRVLLVIPEIRRMERWCIIW